MPLTMSRRNLMRIAALAPALAMPALALPDRGLAQVGGPLGTQPAGHFRCSVGSIALTVLSDGGLMLPNAVFGVNADRAEVTAYLERYYLAADPSYNHANVVLIDAGSARVLVDDGSGTKFQPTAGKLFESLAGAGIDPASITHVLITHAHPDHVWGMTDAAGTPILPQAEIVIGGVEHDFWLAPGFADQAPAEFRPFIEGAVAALTPVMNRIRLVRPGDSVVPGVSVIDTPGHTPGHLSVMVDSDGAGLVITGDAATHALISFERPEWVFGYDSDGPLAVASRRRLLDMAATDKLAVIGYHFPFPGVGNVVREGDAYRFIPALWRWS